MLAVLIIALFFVANVEAFTSSRSGNRAAFRIKPVHENFFLDFAEDPAINTPGEIFGEVAYKTFVSKNNPRGLIADYDIIDRVRELKLLSVTADSGLLEALEAKGLTLSQVEKLLPIADDLGLLPLAVNNQGLLLTLAPLLIEPAPLLLPAVVAALKAPSGVFSAAGFGLIGLGGYEVISDNIFLALPAILLGLPLTAVGSVLGAIGGDIPAPSPSSVKATASAPAVTAKAVASAPKVAAPKLAPAGTTRRRKMVKVGK